MLTIYDRFGDTAVTFDGSWGAAALHVKDKEKTIIARLERELAQMAAQKAELEARIAEAQRDAERATNLLGECRSYIDSPSFDEEGETTARVDEFLDAERKEGKP